MKASLSAKKKKYISVVKLSDIFIQNVFTGLFSVFLLAFKGIQLPVNVCRDDGWSKGSPLKIRVHISS